MRKKLVLGLASLALVLSVSVVMAKNSFPSPARSGEVKQEPNASHLYLYQKDSSWTNVLDGAWGKLTYMSDSFVFNGHEVAPNTDYTLIYYPDVNTGYTLDFECTNGCSGVYTHTMEISSYDEDGFSGTGSYDANPAYTWDVTGESTETFNLVYTGINAGYTVSCVDGVCTSSSSQSFDLEVTDNGQVVWPHPVEVLGEGVANEGGNVHIAGNFDFTSIPWSVDQNSGAKIWLVLSDDVECEGDSQMTGWNPAEYLFENNLITFSTE